MHDRAERGRKNQHCGGRTTGASTTILVGTFHLIHRPLLHVFFGDLLFWSQVIQWHLSGIAFFFLHQTSPFFSVGELQSSWDTRARSSPNLSPWLFTISGKPTAYSLSLLSSRTHRLGNPGDRAADLCRYELGYVECPTDASFAQFPVSRNSVSQKFPPCHLHSPCSCQRFHHPPAGWHRCFAWSSWRPGWAAAGWLLQEDPELRGKKVTSHWKGGRDRRNGQSSHQHWQTALQDR